MDTAAQSTTDEFLVLPSTTERNSCLYGSLAQLESFHAGESAADNPSTRARAQQLRTLTCDWLLSHLQDVARPLLPPALAETLEPNARLWEWMLRDGDGDDEVEVEVEVEVEDGDTVINLTDNDNDNDNSPVDVVMEEGGVQCVRARLQRARTVTSAAMGNEATLLAYTQLQPTTSVVVVYTTRDSDNRFGEASKHKEAVRVPAYVTFGQGAHALHVLRYRNSRAEHYQPLLHVQQAVGKKGLLGKARVLRKELQSRKLVFVS